MSYYLKSFYNAVDVKRILKKYLVFTMNITFFIGNGFDLNIGLETKYSQFYPYFIDHCAKRNMIKKWIMKDADKWSDLELQFGKELNHVTRCRLENFCADKNELENLLAEYLRSEQAKISCAGKEEQIADKFALSLTGYIKDLNKVGQNSLHSTMNTFRNEHFLYSFIDFNYTTILDDIVSITRNLRTPIAVHQGDYNNLNNLLDRVVHINGTIDEGIVLGVDDIDQINNAFMRKNQDALDCLIKQRMNEGIGEDRTNRTKEIINKSHIICIFGMSLGDTDKMWWKEIVSWLDNTVENKLVIYNKDHEEEIKNGNTTAKNSLTKTLKKDFLIQGGIKEPDNYKELMDRIFIVYSTKIFDFKKIFFPS